MMKKLLVLSLVMGIASLATAGIDNLDFSVDGVVAISGTEVTVSPGQHTIGIYNSELFTGASALTWVEVPLGAEIAGSGVQVNPELLPGTWTITDEAPGGVYGGSYYWYIVNTDPAVGDSGVGDWFTFDIIAGSVPEPLTITLYKDDFVTELGTVDLVTPEPMTMALLGLGGLLIRRKK